MLVRVQSSRQFIDITSSTLIGLKRPGLEPGGCEFESHLLDNIWGCSVVRFCES